MIQRGTREPGVLPVITNSNFLQPGKGDLSDSCMFALPNHQNNKLKRLSQIRNNKISLLNEQNTVNIIFNARKTNGYHMRIP